MSLSSVQLHAIVTALDLAGDHLASHPKLHTASLLYDHHGRIVAQLHVQLSQLRAEGERIDQQLLDAARDFLNGDADGVPATIEPDARD